LDNVTHSLVGVALADLSIGRTSKAHRSVFVGAGIIAANLPDIDLAYAAITPSPLGYLLHHRGHTHTILGLAGLGGALFLAYWFFPAVRKMRLSGRLRFWLLIAVALASHLALDALNSYGVHPFYPADNTWYFGDAVFILEPWLWLLLGIVAAWNGRSGTARLTVAVPVLVLLAAAAWMGAIPFEVVGLLAVAGGIFASAAYGLSPRARAVWGLAMCAVIIGGFIGASRMARRAAVDALHPVLRGPVTDVILTPNPASPLCWSVIVIERRETAAEYVLWRGTLSLAPAWTPPTACASHRIAGAQDARILGEGRFALRDTRSQSLTRLRRLAVGDCWVRAWLRFGRAPVIEGGSIYDLRFAERIGENFSRMELIPRGGCPSNVPNWGTPRADLLGAAGVKAE
jgi:inner membrane protein